MPNEIVFIFHPRSSIFDCCYLQNYLETKMSHKDDRNAIRLILKVLLYIIWTCTLRVCLIWWGCGICLQKNSFSIIVGIRETFSFVHTHRRLKWWQFPNVVPPVPSVCQTTIFVWNMTRMTWKNVSTRIRVYMCTV